MPWRFARPRFAFFRALSPSTRIFLGLAGPLGLYYASKIQKIHADTSTLHVPKYPHWVPRREEFSGMSPVQGVKRVDWICWPSNFPCEDVVATRYDHDKAWSFWAIYDGTSGPQTAWHLEQHLFKNLVDSLSEIYSAAGENNAQPKKEIIHDTFKRVFLDLDDEMVYKSADQMLEMSKKKDNVLRVQANQVLAAAHAGASSLVAFYDANLRTLHLSGVGAGRVLLGRRREPQQSVDIVHGNSAPPEKTLYDLHDLSPKHTLHNPAEVKRLKAEHPNEKNLFSERTGRYMDWGVITRSFGFGVLKWTKDMQIFLWQRCLGEPLRDNVRTPPYLTAEPDTKTVDIEPGDFLILASEGTRFTHITKEVLVGLVGAWLDRAEGNATAFKCGDLPVELTKTSDWWFTNEDSNAAFHIGRNALGGADADAFQAQLDMPISRSRWFRQDLSVIVVFFE